MAEPKLQLSDAVEIWRPEHAADPIIASFCKMEGRLLTVRLKDCPFPQGAVLSLRTKVPDDGRYLVNGTLRGVTGGTALVELVDSWTRVQQREYFRMRTGKVPVEIVRQASKRAEDDSRAKTVLCNVSAGGSLIETSLALEVGEIITMSFNLPGLYPLTLAAKVLRVIGPNRRRWRVGVSFRSATADQRTDILGWVYQRQLDSRARERELDY